MTELMIDDGGAEAVLAAGRALAGAGRWDLAADLLASVGGDDPRFLLARAQLSVWRDFWLGTDGAAEAIARAAAAAEQTDDPCYGWEVELCALQRDYFASVAPPDGPARIGPDQHEPAVREQLTTRAEHLQTSAPPDARGGWAAFWRGAIADNIAGNATAARSGYEQALSAAELAGDDELAAEALRHLGAHARRAGDHDEAGRMWERSTQLRQRSGMVPGALSQQLTLARHAADTGAAERAATIAAEVHRWADALQLTRLATQAGSFRPEP